MTSNTAPATAPSDGYPRWDESHASTLTSTDDVHVEMDVDPGSDGSTLMIRRTVWSKAYRAKDRHVLWTGVVAVIPRENASRFAADFVASLAA